MNRETRKTRENSPTDSGHVLAARQRLAARDAARRAEDRRRQRQAECDAQAIVEHIVQGYRPLRVYQWGSLLRRDGFRDYSDIDIAVEGIVDAETFFRLLGEAQAMTKFPVDLVQIETIAPEYAEDIRRLGRKVYERE